MNPFELFIDYLKYEKRYSQHTITSYCNDLTQVKLYLHNQYDLENIHDAKAIHLRSWIVFLLENKILPRSINRKISTLKSYFKFAISKEWLLLNPMHKIIAPKTSKRLPEWVDEKDMFFLLDNLQYPDGWEGQRDRLVIELFYATGMRLSELVGLQDYNIDHQKCQIKVLGKGNKERLIPLPKPLLPKIVAYQTAKKQLFAAHHLLLLNNNGQAMATHFVYGKVRHYLSQVTTIKKKSPHILRHTYATHLLNKGADLTALKELLGHTSLAATQVYTHNSIERLKSIYQQAHPRA
jgi:integrase/recombinase XerC